MVTREGTTYDRSSLALSGAALANFHESIMPQGTINIIWSYKVCLFFFIVGRAVRVQHIRNGKELKEVVYDNNYDFNFQVRALQLL